jgi:16S rRNA C1402 (ribose-2'-O) methylase RsmI
VEPRGEYVVVLEGAPAAMAADDGAILDLLRAELHDGVDRRTAIATVMSATGAAKRRVYDLALTIPR